MIVHVEFIVVAHGKQKGSEQRVLRGDNVDPGGGAAQGAEDGVEVGLGRVEAFEVREFGAGESRDAARLQEALEVGYRRVREARTILLQVVDVRHFLPVHLVEEGEDNLAVFVTAIPLERPHESGMAALGEDGAPRDGQDLGHVVHAACDRRWHRDGRVHGSENCGNVLLEYHLGGERSDELV